MGKNRDNVDTFNILKDGFLRQHKEKRNIEKEKYHLFCDTCLTEQNHYEFNQFYSFGEHLIICFFRGKNYENDKKIDVEEKLEFPRNEKPVPMPEKENAYNKYYLVGSVNRVINKGKDEFYYFARDPKIKNQQQSLISIQIEIGDNQAKELKIDSIDDVDKSINDFCIENNLPKLNYEEILFRYTKAFPDVKIGDDNELEKDLKSINNAIPCMKKILLNLKSISIEEAEEVDVIPIIKELLSNDKLKDFLKLT